MDRWRLVSLVLFLAGVLVLVHEVYVVGQPLELKDLWVPVVKTVPYLSHELIALLLFVAGVVVLSERLRGAAYAILAYLVVATVIAFLYHGLGKQLKQLWCKLKRLLGLG